MQMAERVDKGISRRGFLKFMAGTAALLLVEPPDIQNPEKRRQGQNVYFLTKEDAELYSESNSAVVKGTLPAGTFVSVNYYSPDGEMIAVNSFQGGYVARENLSPIEEETGQPIFPDLDPSLINRIYIRRAFDPEAMALAKLRKDIYSFELNGEPAVIISDPNQIVFPTGRRTEDGFLQDKINLEPGSPSLEDCEYVFEKNAQGQWDNPNIPALLEQIKAQKKVDNYEWDPHCDFTPSLPSAGFLEPDLVAVLQDPNGNTFRFIVATPSIRVASQYRWFPMGCVEKKRTAASSMDLGAAYFLRIRPEVDEYGNEHPQDLGILNPLLAAPLKEQAQALVASV
jgi:hypothetical protein